MAALWFVALVLWFPLLSFAQGLQKGDIFPTFELKDGLSKKDYGYLGLSEGSLFAKGRTNLNSVDADLLFIEFLNKYCVVCQKDAPEFARLFQEIEMDQRVKGKVKILGVAVGNSVKEVQNFKKEYSIGFPILSDVESLVYRKIGSPGGSPLVYVLKRMNDRWVIVDGFKGEAKYADLMMRAKVDLEIDAGNVKRSALWTEEPLKKTGEMEVRRLLIARMPDVRIVKAIPFDNGDLFIIDRKGETLFAKAEARKIICDVCHDAFFIYIFDHKGIIRDFIPVRLTKADNRPFSSNDVDRIRHNLVGRNMLTPFKFDKEVDAVTSATLTSLVIYDSVHHGRELLRIVEKEVRSR
jgi:peroxiredoxin